MSDRPTPHSTAVCMLIALHSDPVSVIHNPPNDSYATISKQDIQNHLSKVIQHIVLQTSNFIDGNFDEDRPSLSNIESMTFKQLLKKVAGTNFGFAHAAKFLFEDMRRASTSIDSLIDLFAAFRWTVSHGVVDGDSSYGIYVRKRCLGFDELEFDAVVRFWENVCDYVDRVEWNDFEREFGVVSKGRKSVAQLSKPSHTNEGDISKWPLSPVQISRSLLFHCRALDQQNGKLSFDEMEVSLQELLHENPELTLAHFLRFLNCINNGERVKAVESLHRYFDYAMIYQRKERLLSASRGLVDDTNPAIQQGNQNIFQQGSTNPSLSDILSQASKKSNVVHYIAVILCSVFFQFGNQEMALLSAEESIRVAQQNGDKACFAYALGWLNILTTRDELSEENYQIHNDSISALFHQSRNRLGHLHEKWGDAAANISSPTSNVLGNIAHLSDIATNLQYLAVRNLEPTQAYSRYHMTSVDIWQSVGRTNLALATNELLQFCYSQILSHSDISSISSKISSSLLYGTQKMDCSMNILDSGSLITALENVKSKHHKTTSIEKVKQKNQIQSVIDQLIHLQRKNPHFKSYSLYHNILRLAHEGSTRNCNLSLSLAIEPILYSSVPMSRGYNPEAIVETWSQSCILLCQRNKFNDAVTLISSQVIPFCQKNYLRRHECVFLLELARIRLEFSTNDPVIALPTLLDCLALADESSIDSLYAAALVLYSSFLFASDDIVKSRAVLNAVLPNVMEHCHIYYQGEAWLVASKCSLRECALDKQNNKYGLDQPTLMRRALSEIRNGIYSFEKIGDVRKLRELYYLEAQAYNRIGSMALRDISSRKFVEMNSKIVSSILPSWSSYTILQELF